MDSFISLYTDFEIIETLSEMGNRDDVWIDRKDIVVHVYMTMFRRDVPRPEELDDEY